MSICFNSLEFGGIKLNCFYTGKQMKNWKIERIDEKRIKITHLGAGIILSDINLDKRMTFMYDYFSQLLEENKK